MSAIDSPLGALLQPLHTAFGLWWNRRHQGLGQVFAERPRSILIDHEEGLARLVAYIHNNPVRAGLVADPIDSDWTSHRAYVLQSTPPEWLAVEWTLAAMGFSSSPSGRCSFHSFVCSRANLVRDPTLSGPGPLVPGAVIRIRSAVADVTGVDVAQIMKPGADTAAIRARHVFLFVASFVLGATGAQVSRELGVAPSTTSKALRQVRAWAPPASGLVDRVMHRFLAGGEEQEP